MLTSHSLRHYIGVFRQETLMGRLSTLLSSVKSYDFEVLALEPHVKDGGVFVHFKYSASDPKAALDDISKSIQTTASKHGGIPSWTGFPGRGGAWLVKGSPWREVRSLHTNYPLHLPKPYV